MSPAPADNRAPSRALVLGATGMVGRAWRGLLTSHGIEHRALARPEFDLLDTKTIDAIDFGGVDLVVNASAWTDVDGAEADPDGATKANGAAVRRIAERCDDAGCTLIHYSTDYIFDGAHNGPIPVDLEPDPINAYGRSKLEGEHAIEATGCDSIVIRTSWVYAPWGKNFVRTIAKLAGERDTLRVVSDQRGRPTSAEHLARSSLALAMTGGRGVWHATDAGACTWFEFAREIVSLVGSGCTVEPCTSEEFPRPAKRPANSVLDIAPTESLLGPLTPWQLALADVVRRLTID